MHHLLGSIAASLGGFASAHPWAALIVAVIAIWQGSVLVNPYAKCRRCDGVDKFYGWFFKKAWHSCPTCQGTGRRLRPGGSGSPRARPEDRRTRRR